MMKDSIHRRPSGRRAVRLLILVLLAVLFQTATGDAAVTFYSIFKNVIYTQTSNSQPASPTQFFASAQIEFDNAANLNASTVTFTGTPSPLALSSAGTGRMNANVSFGSLVGMDTAFPGTSYQFAIGGGNLGSQNASLTVPASDLFATQTPFLSGTSYSGLQGMDVANARTLTWAGYTAAAGINDADIFLAINRFSDGLPIFNSGALSNSQTSLLLPANTLSPGVKYQFELSYSSRTNTANAGFSTAHSLVGFDLRANGTFTTLAPEPSSAVVWFAGMAVIARKRARRSQRLAV